MYSPNYSDPYLERVIKDLLINSKERFIDFNTPKIDCIYFSRKRIPIKNKKRI